MITRRWIYVCVWYIWCWCFLFVFYYSVLFRRFRFLTCERFSFHHIFHYCVSQFNWQTSLMNSYRYRIGLRQHKFCVDLCSSCWKKIWTHESACFEKCIKFIVHLLHVRWLVITLQRSKIIKICWFCSQYIAFMINFFRHVLFIPIIFVISDAILWNDFFGCNESFMMV